MRTPKVIKAALKEEIEDSKNCKWVKPCASCFKSKVIQRVLRWVLGEVKDLDGNK